MNTKRDSRAQRLCLALFLGVGLMFYTVDLRAQEPAPQATADEIRAAQDQKIQQLQDKLEEIQQEILELKRANSAQPETHHFTTAKASAPPPSISEAEPVDNQPLQSKFRAVRLCRFHMAHRQRPHERYSVRNQVLHAGDPLGRQLHLRLPSSAGRHHRRIERDLPRE